MFNFLKLFSFAFLLIFAHLSGESNPNLDPYLLFVTDVDPEAHRFVLSNKMVFHVAKNNWMTGQFPEIGMEARFAPFLRDVKNFSAEEEGELQAICFFHPKNKLINVWMSEASKAYCLSFARSESRCIEPAGWFSSGVYREVIVLSDGSKWIPEGEDQLPFIKGDRLMISKMDDERWAMMNIDQMLVLTDPKGERYKRIMAIVVYPDLQEGSN